MAKKNYIEVIDPDTGKKTRYEKDYGNNGSSSTNVIKVKDPDTGKFTYYEEDYKPRKRGTATAYDPYGGIDFNQFDPDILKSIGDTFQSQWGDKYYYDMFDPEDAMRSMTGTMPKYLDKYYNLDDPVDQWLYQNNLPYRDVFSDMYSEHALEHNAAIAEENAYQQEYLDFRKDLYNLLDESRIAGGDYNEAFEGAIVGLLTDPKYANVAQHFSGYNTEDSPEEGTYEFFEQQQKQAKKKPDNRAFTANDLLTEYDSLLKEAEKKALATIENESREAIAQVETLDEQITALEQDLAQTINRPHGIETPEIKEKRAQLAELKASRDQIKGQIGMSERDLERADAAKVIDQFAAADLPDGSNWSSAVDSYWEANAKNEDKRVRQDIAGLVGAAYVANGATDQIPEILRPGLEGTNFLAEMQELFQHAKPEEVQLFNRVLASGEENALAFYEAFIDELQFRSVEKRKEDAAAYAAENPILASIQSVGDQYGSAIEGVGNLVGGAFADKLGIDASDIMYNSRFTDRSSTSRGTVAEKIAASSKNATTGEILSFLYQTGMSMADTAARLPFGSAGLAVAGASAASNTMSSVLAQGGTIKQAAWLGGVAGVAEAAMEYLPLERLLKAKAAGSPMGMIREAIRQAGLEGSEELVTEFANILADEIVRSEDSDLRRDVAALVESGMTEGKALTQVLVQRIGGAALGGILSGGVFGAGGQMIRIATTPGGMKTIRAAQEAVSPIAPETAMQFANDVRSLGLPKKPTQRLIDEFDRIIGDPSLLARAEGVQIVTVLMEATKNLSNRVAEQTSRTAAKQQKVLNRQANMYQAILDAKAEADAALKNGDKAAHEKAAENWQKAMKAYSDAVKVDTHQKTADDAQNEQQKANIKREAQRIADEAATQTNAVAEMIAAEIERDNLAQQEAFESGQTPAQVRNALGDDVVSQMVALQARLAAEEGQDPITDAESFDEFGEESLLEDMALAQETGDTALFNELDEQYNNLYRDTDIMDATINGGNENGLRVSEDQSRRNDRSDRQRNDGREVRGSESGMGGEARGVQSSETSEDGSQSKENPQSARSSAGRGVSTWSDSDRAAIPKLVKDYNGKRKTNVLSEQNVRTVDKVDPATEQRFAIAKSIIGGGDAFLFAIDGDSAKVGLHGAADGKHEYVRYTGKSTDVFHWGHERAENNKAYRDAANSVMSELGSYAEGVLDSYIDTYDNPKGRSRAELRKEFLCDMFGAYLYRQTEGNEIHDRLGVSDDIADKFYDAFDAALDAGAIEYTDDLTGTEFSTRSMLEAVNLDSKIDENGALTVTKNGQPVEAISTNDVKHTRIGSLIKRAVDRGFISEEDAGKQRTFIRDLTNMLLDIGDADLVWAFAGTQVFSAITNNADAQYGKTVDFTTICRKTQAIVDAMSEAMLQKKRGLTDDEITEIHRDLVEKQELVPCKGCYVFSRWIGIGGLLGNIKTFQDKYADIDVARAALNDPKLDSKAKAWIQQVRLNKNYKPVPDEVLFDLNRGGEFASQYPVTWRYRTTRGPSMGKAITPYAEMRVGEVIQGIRKNPNKIQKGEKNPFYNSTDGMLTTEAEKEALRSEEAMRRQNLLGGLRYQSTSDFRYEYALDYLLSFFDVQAIGGKIQTYTKVADAVPLLAAAGADVNLSLWPSGRGFIEKNGEKVLNCSSVEGMDFETAVTLKNKYDNTQLIMVGVNDDHIRLSLADSDIGFVIPYHASGAKKDIIAAFAKNLGEDLDAKGYQDYSDVQTDTIDPNSTPKQTAARELRNKILSGKAKTLSKEETEILNGNEYLSRLYDRFYTKGVDDSTYGVVLKSSQRAMIMPFEYWDTNTTIETADQNGERFKEYCETLGIIPRFSGKVVNGGQVKTVAFGNFADDPGYWKTLIDRPMYNNDGSYHVQQTINVSNISSEMLSPDGEIEFSENDVIVPDINEPNSGFPASVEHYGEARKRSTVKQFATFEMSGVDTTDRIILGVVPERLANDVAAQAGIDIRGLNNVLHSDGLRHGAKHDAQTGNIPITPDDVVNALDIFENYESITVTKKKRGEVSIKLQRTNPDGLTYIAVIGKKKGHIYTKNMWKMGKQKTVPIAGQMPFVAPASTPVAAANVKPSIGNILPVSGQKSNTSSGNSSTENSENTISEPSFFTESAQKPLTRNQQVMQEAQRLYAAGTTPTQYFEQTYGNRTFDNAVNRQLRGMMIRNGQDVGGFLSEQKLGEINATVSKNQQLSKLRLSSMSPYRVFQKIYAPYKNDTIEHIRANNKASKAATEATVEYGLRQTASMNLWLERVRNAVNNAYADSGIHNSIAAHMLGENAVTAEEMQDARYDRNYFIAPTSRGVIVCDSKGKILAWTHDGDTTFFDEKTARAIRSSHKVLAQELDTHDARLKERRLVEQMNAKMRGIKPIVVPGMALTTITDGNNIEVRLPDGSILAKVTDGGTVDVDRAQTLTDELRRQYDDAWLEQNKVLVENGYAPMGRVENYFQRQIPADASIQDVIKAFTEADSIPTAISGMTGGFKPGHPWAAHLLQKHAALNRFDAVAGWNNYARAAGRVIYQTPVVQRIRQFEQYIRAQESGDNRSTNNSNFAAWLLEYGNQWANKKPALDRGFEAMFGRIGFTVADKLTRATGQSAVVGNVSSALSNIISVLTAVPDLDATVLAEQMGVAVTQGMAAVKEDPDYDGFAEKIPFLAARYASYEDILTHKGKAAYRNAIKVAGALFAATDRIAAETVARTKYQQCLNEGMTEEQAVAATDEFCIKNFADRSVGQRPAIFTSKALSPITQFGLEAMNQLSFGSDTRQRTREWVVEEFDRQLNELVESNGGTIDGIDIAALEKEIRGRGARKDLGKFMLYALLLSLWGGFTRALMGRDQTWNPIGMAADATRAYKDGGAKAAGASLMESVLDQTPVVGSLLGGGRIPAAGITENTVQLAKDVLNGDENWWKSLFTLGASVVPGGSQLKKSIQGVGALIEGGNYTDSGRLRYPIDASNPLKAAQTVVFGKSAAAPDDYSWGSDVLSDKKTEQYHAAVDAGVDSQTAYDALLGVTGSTNAEKALSLAAAAKDEDDQNIIAEVLGLDFNPKRDGTLSEWGTEQADIYLEKKQKELKKGDITQAKYDELEAVFDEYFRLLGMTN